LEGGFVQNEVTGAKKKRIIIASFVGIIFIIFIGTLFFTRNNNSATTTNNAPIEDVSATIEDYEWGIELPSTRFGNMFTDLDSTTEVTRFIVPSTGAQVEQKYIVVRGVDPTENVCTLPFAASAIYRHKEENPGIDYTTAFNLNAVDVKKIKVGDWWFSTSSIITDGECFPKGVSEDENYLSLAKQYFSDFLKMKKLSTE